MSKNPSMSIILIPNITVKLFFLTGMKYARAIHSGNIGVGTFLFESFSSASDIDAKRRTSLCRIV